ncbi:MAG: PIG-L deacetylase family protein [Bryobacteraceae bacterium]
MSEPNIPAFSAHTADLCSRSGATLALYARRGASAHVIDVTFGERGESEDYWRRPGPKSIEEAKRVRAAETEDAARIIGVPIESLDYGDYPLVLGRERLEAMARLIPSREPDIILTHWKCDPFDVDHQVTSDGVLSATDMAAIPGFDHEIGKGAYLYSYVFEPTVPRNDAAGFCPDHYVEIDEVSDLKMSALAVFWSQFKLAGFCTKWTQYRGFQAAQTAGRPIRHAGACQRYTAAVDTRLPSPVAMA